MKDLLIKYKSVIMYIIFGILTTVVNIVIYYICAHIINMNTMVSTGTAWVISVLFAYITNRKYVFESNNVGMEAILKEIISFFSCRLATGILDMAIMYIFVDILHFADLPIKVFSNIIVIVLNYIASKLIIFRKET